MVTNDHFVSASVFTNKALLITRSILSCQHYQNHRRRGCFGAQNLCGC